METPEKRDAIMRAALELVGERGFHGTPMSLVARRAGVAAGTIYRFFDGKDTLIKEVYASLEGQLFAAVLEGYPADEPVRERFRHIARRLIAFFIASPLQFRFLEQFHNSPYGVECRRDRAFGRREGNVITALFADAAEQGILRDLPLPILFALTFGPLVEVCRDHVLEFITLDGPLIEQTVDACWDAVRQPPPVRAAG